MNNLRIIDADGHVQERDADWQELLDPPYRKHAPKMVSGPDGKEQLLLEGKIWAKPSGTGLGIGTAPYSRRPQKTTGMFDPVRRLQDMDLEGIDTAVNFGTTVFLSLPFLEDHDLACAIAHAYNTWLDGYCKTSPERLKGVALVPMQEPKEAVKELERCVKELGFVAVATSAHSAGVIWITLISIPSMPRRKNSAFPYVFMSVPAGPPRPPSASTMRFSCTRRRTPSSK